MDGKQAGVTAETRDGFGTMWVAKSLVTLQAALCSYRHDGSRLRAYLFFQPRSATACQHAQTPLRSAPVSACAGRAACSRRGPGPFRRPLVTYQWSQRSALGRGLRVPPSAGGLARCTAPRKATRSGQVGSGCLGASAGPRPTCPGLPRHDRDHTVAYGTPLSRMWLSSIRTHAAPPLTGGRLALETSALCFG